MIGRAFRYRHGPSGWQVEAEDQVDRMLVSSLHDDTAPSNFPNALPAVGHRRVAGYWYVFVKPPNREEVIGAVLRPDEYRGFQFDPYRYAADELQVAFVREAMDRAPPAKRGRIGWLVAASDLPDYLPYAYALFRELRPAERENAYWSALPLNRAPSDFFATSFSLHGGSRVAAEELCRILQEEAAPISEAPAATNSADSAGQPPLATAETGPGPADDTGRLVRRLDVFRGEFARLEAEVTQQRIRLHDFVQTQTERNEKDARRRASQWRVLALSFLAMLVCLAAAMGVAVDARLRVRQAQEAAQRAVEVANGAQAAAEQAEAAAKTATASAQVAKTQAEAASEDAQAAQVANDATKEAVASAVTTKTLVEAARQEAQNAAATAVTAKTLAEAAKQDAQTAAAGAATVKTQAETARQEGKEAVASAVTAKTQAEAAKQEAKESAVAAVTARTLAEAAKQEAQTAAAGAVTAKTQAETAKREAKETVAAAVTAKTDAEAARQEARNAAKEARAAAKEARELVAPSQLPEGHSKPGPAGRQAQSPKTESKVSDGR